MGWHLVVPSSFGNKWMTRSRRAYRYSYPSSFFSAVFLTFPARPQIAFEVSPSSWIWKFHHDDCSKFPCLELFSEIPFTSLPSLIQRVSLIMRTRSQPLSPGGLQSLEDKPKRRRATRSVSAQPQEAESATDESQPLQSSMESETAPKSRKTRARKGTVGKKVS